MPYKPGDPRAKEASIRAWETRRKKMTKDLNNGGVKKVNNPSSAKSGLPKTVKLNGKEYYNTLALAKKWKCSDNTILRLRKEQGLEQIELNYEILTVDLKEGPSEIRTKAAQLRSKKASKESPVRIIGLSEIVSKLKDAIEKLEFLQRTNVKLADFLTSLEKKIADTDTHVKLLDINMSNSMKSLQLEVAAIPRDQFNGIKLKEVPPPPEPPKPSAGPARLIKMDSTDKRT
jgi:hypothetical protein